MASIISKTDDGSFSVECQFARFCDDDYIQKRDYEKAISKALDEVEKYKKAFENSKQERDKQVSEMMAHIDFLKAELLERQCHYDKSKQNMLDEPIDVAAMLIKATVTVKTNSIQKAFATNMPDEYEIKRYSERDLRQIAEHLLAYCNNSEGEE